MKYPILIGLMSLGIIGNSWAQSSLGQQRLSLSPFGTKESSMSFPSQAKETDLSQTNSIGIGKLKQKIRPSVEGALKVSFEIKKDHIQVDGGVVNGGGGGFICPPNESCKTLAEAGLKIKVSSTDSGQINPTYTIPLEVVNEVKAIFSQVAFPKRIKEALLNKVVGEYGTYQIVEETDADKFSKIKAQYEKVVQNQASSIGMKDFKLVAWSDTCVNQKYPDKGNENAKTYLLPAFEKLSLRQKALNLIHEANYRARCEDKLDMVLAFDAKLEELLANPKLIYDKDYDLIELGTIFKNLDWDWFFIPARNSVVFLIEMLKRKNQSLVRLDSFCNTIDARTSSCHVSYEKLLQLASFDKRIPDIIQGALISLFTRVYGTDYAGMRLPPESPYMKTLAAACNNNFDLKSRYSKLNSLLMTTEGIRLDDAAVSGEALGLEDLYLVAIQCVPKVETGSWDVWISIIDVKY